MTVGAGVANLPERRRDLRPVLLLCGIFLALVWPAIFAGGGGTSEAHDHHNYHEPVIRTFAAQLPHPDLVNYQSATSPGYHLFMAAISRYVTDRTVVLQLISSLFSLGLVLIVYRAAAARVDRWLAMLLTIPLLFSPYLLSGAIWLTTDNAAWMFVALALGGCVMYAASPARAIGCSLAAVVAVAIRQIHVWVAAPMALAVMMPDLFTRPLNQGFKSRFTFGRIVAAATALAPIALVGWFIITWGGLMPPAYVDLHNRGMNPAMLPITLSLIGGFGMFFLPAIGLETMGASLRRRNVWIAAALGIVIAIAVPTSFSRDDGRWGGAIWQVAKMLPVIADRSVLFVPLAAVGCMVLTILWQSAARAGRGRAASLLLFALACWAAAQLMNSQAWQRYCEPIALFTLAWLTSLATPPPLTPHNAHQSLAIPALLACAAIQLALSAVTVYMPMLGWR